MPRWLVVAPSDSWSTTTVPLNVPAVAVLTETFMLLLSVDPAARLVIEPAKPGVSVLPPLGV